MWLLDGKKGVYNFWPLRIAGKGDDDIRLVEFPCNGYCILKVLVYISWASNEGWW